MKNLFRIVEVILLIFLIHSCETDDDNSIKDDDGNVYTSVTIGTQVWMAENLKTTKYRNGDFIGTTIPATLDISGESTPKYQWAYDGNESNVATYGRLYTLYAVTDSRGVCPSGWHLPSYDEWTTLITYLGGRPDAGGKLKETGTTHWISPNKDATNDYDFTALPGGGRFNIDFDGIGYDGYWWSPIGSSTGDYSHRLNCEYGGVTIGYYDMYSGFSVRCLKDN